ncbi:MAG TPA: hypothetical protein VKF41_09675 [Bryobacteraceae bacterium]|nr:hypothetical protein [Bryobacteraceae bacterium]
MAEPYISVVVAARNDNHGGNMLGRMQAFLDSWTVQAERYGLPSEIVVVEWNPPASSPRLIDALRRPPQPGPCAVRFVEVAPELHAALPNSTAIPLHQMIAKNAGIRRARGQFVLATNIDIVFSPELMRFLAGRSLDRGVLYRVDRYDVADAIPDAAAGVDALLEHCNSRLLRVFAAEGTFGVRDGEPRCDEERDIADAGIGFGRGWNPVEQQDDRRYRWIASVGRVFFERPPGSAMTIIAEVGPSNGGEPLKVEVLDASGAVVAAALVEGRCRLRLHFPDSAESGVFTLRAQGRAVPLFPEIRLLHFRVHGLRWETAAGKPADWRLEMVEAEPGTDWAATLQAPAPEAARMRNAGWLHVNASGDFTLLARDAWFRLRAYPEFPIWPVHVDALFCYAAHHAGMRETVLRDPMRIFHIEHSSGAGWTPEGEQALHTRVAELRVPVLDFDGDIGGWVQHMRRLNAPAIFNLESWGLAGVDLPERQG